jgi:hypothetical protein
MKKNTASKYLTEATFKKSLKSTNQQFKSIDERFERIDRRFDEMGAKFNGLTLLVTRHDADIKEIKATMMTRALGDQILTQLQDFASKYEESERSARIHLAQLMEFRPQLDNHEKRLVALENQGQ